MKRFNQVLAFVLAFTCCLQCVSFGQRATLTRSFDRPIQPSSEIVGETPREYIGRRPPVEFRIIDPSARAATGKRHEAGQENTRLYTPDEADEGREDYAFTPDEDFIARRKQTAYPSIYRPGNASGVILVVGFPECGWCKVVLKNIPGVSFPAMRSKPMKIESTGYRVMYVHKDRTDKLNKDDDAPTWDDLLTKFKLKKVYPTVIMIEKGKMTKAFSGFKPWATIQPHVEAAKITKDEDDNEEPKRRSFFDFLFPKKSVDARGSDRGVGGVKLYGASPTRNSSPD